MASTEQQTERTRDDLVAEILKKRQPRRFEEMLGPDPQLGDEEDLEEFLDYLQSQRRPVRTPSEEGHS